MSDTPKLPTPAEQEQQYHGQRLVFERKFAEWKQRGMQGPPPPHPVKPHTPGQRLPDDLSR